MAIMGLSLPNLIGACVTCSGHACMRCKKPIRNSVELAWYADGDLSGDVSMTITGCAVPLRMSSFFSVVLLFLCTAVRARERNTRHLSGDPQALRLFVARTLLLFSTTHFVRDTG